MKKLSVIWYFILIKIKYLFIRWILFLFINIIFKKNNLWFKYFIFMIFKCVLYGVIEGDEG